MDILNQFGVKPLLLAAQVVNFLILLFILKKFLYKPILKVLEERKKRIEDSLRNAETIEKKLLKTQEDSEKILAKALEEAQKITEETKKDIAIMKEEGKLQAEQQAADIIRKTEEIIKMEKEKMMVEVKAEVGSLIVTVFQKVTGKSLTKEDQRKIIEREVKNIS